MTFTSYYALLKVAPWATPQDIRRSYRELSKLYHPDTTVLPETVATEKFQQINEAYGILRCPDKRAKYDLEHGYSRFSTVKPTQDLNQPVQSFWGLNFQRDRDRIRADKAYLDPNDRPLSPGELFAVLLLGCTFVGCIALVIAVGLFRGDIVLPAAALMVWAFA